MQSIAQWLPDSCTGLIFAVLQQNHIIVWCFSAPEIRILGTITVDKAMIDLTEPLNGRELEILRRIAKGQSSTQIAEALHLRPNTVLWYRKRLYAKLDVHSVAAFTTELHRRGLV
jgi:DNA-binding CsgD family transcriptional regulator